MLKESRLKILFTSILFLFLIISCGDKKKTELVPKDVNDEQVLLTQTETITKDSVTVTVSSDAWNGNDEVKKEVTPLKIKVENNNEKPIEITYDKLSLVTKDGDLYAALPIYDVRGDLDKAELIMEDTITVKTEMNYDRFYLYPMYTHVINDVPVSQYQYFGKESYYKKYYADWKDTGMPTSAMRNLALPEGTLENGGSISGFVYFQKVDPDLKEITLNMAIVNAESDLVINSIKVPFWVVE